MQPCKKCKSMKCQCDKPKSKGSMPKPFPPKKPKK